jgi:D-alanine-D-alanine ligase
MIDTYIEIVRSSNPRLNAMASGTRETVRTALRKRYTKVGETVVNDMAGLEALVAKKPDLVILGMKMILLDPAKGYDDSPKLWLSDYLETHNIAYIGSGTRALATEFDKPIAKQKVMDAALHSSAYFTSSIKQPVYTHSLEFPLFVKPANGGGSKGIDEMSVVYTQPELEAKITEIHNEWGFDALIEEYLSGREFSVAVMRQKSGALLAMPIEITSPADTKGNSFLSKAVKSADTEQVLAVDDMILKDKLNTLAIGVFEALGSRDFGRIDMRLNSMGEPSFIEANLMPGLSNHGYLSRCFAINEDIAYEDMILSIADLGLQRISA